VEVLEFTTGEIGALVGSFLWPLFRIMGFFLTVPIISTQLVPARVRLVLALAIAVLISPVLHPMPQLEGISVAAMFIVLQQLLIGAALGFFLQLMFQVFILTGQMIAMQMGLGFASMVDPTNGVSVAILSSIYLMFATLLFITLNGHLVMIEVLVDSFYSLPVGGGGLSPGAMLQIVHTISWVFTNALQIALPAITALLITNFAFGIMTKAAPQMNIFALGFPVALMFGLFIVWISLSSFFDSAASIFTEAMMMMRDLTAG